MPNGNAPDPNQCNPLSTDISTELERTRKPTDVEAFEKAKELLGYFLVNKCDNPARFAFGVAKVLSKYSIEVVEHICDPFTGIPSKQTWPPSIFEIIKACSARTYDLERYERLANRRKTGANTIVVESPRLVVEIKPTLQEMYVKYGENFGVSTCVEPIPASAPIRTNKETAQHYLKHPINFRKGCLSFEATPLSSDKDKSKTPDTARDET